MRYIIVILLLSILLPAALRSQGDDTTEQATRPNLRLIARAYGDSIVLRWGTTTHTAWKVAGSKGYMIERYELRGTNSISAPSILTAAPIKPLTIDEWKARYRRDDTLAGAAVQALYGKPVVTSDDPFGSIYEIYLQQKNMFGFALVMADIAPRIADGLGLRFVDRSARRDRTYLYRLYSLANNPDEPIDTAFVVVSPGEIYETPSVTSIAADEQEKLVVLKWDRYEHVRPFSGYFIERSTDGGATFTRMNNIPFLPIDDPNSDAVNGSGETTYRIKLDENYRPARYRIVGIDAFGELSPNSRVITAMGRDRTAPGQPQMLPLKIVDGHSVRVAWQIDSIEADLAGFYVAKAEDTEGPFDRIGEMLPLSAREFTDNNVSGLPQHYYVVAAVDTAGNTRYSVPLLGMFPDSIPPAVPAGLRGSIDSNGVVTLRWNANGERDLRGYRVFYANQDDHEYQQLTTDITADTLFTDTLMLETLTEEIHYRVTALDRNFNHSPFSATLTLAKPDVVIPAAPIVSDITSSDRSVALAWKPSPTSDVVEHLLYRRAEGEEEWREIARGAGSDFRSFTDTSAAAGTTYEYSVRARDDAGHLSIPSNVVTGRVHDAVMLPPVAEVTPTVDTSASRIVIRWSARPGKAERIYIYRAAGDGQLSLYRSVDGAATEFADNEIIAGTRYRYGVKAVTDKGEESSMATTAPIEYN